MSEEKPGPEPRIQTGQPPFSGLTGKIIKFFLRKTTGIELPERGKDWHDTITLDAGTVGEGGEVEYDYKKWGKPRNLMVRIPLGVRNGQVIKLSGMGAAGKAGGGAGDLYLRVQIKRTLAQRLTALFKA